MDGVNFANDCSKCNKKEICKYVEDVAKTKDLLGSVNGLRGDIFPLLIDVECRFWE